jgi:hypothetical protein
MKIPSILASFAATMAVIAAPVQAQSACAASVGTVELSAAQITAVLTNRTVCGVPGSAYPGSPGDRFQEEHLANGDLFDYKLGPGHPVDPREKVGTWSVTQGGGLGGGAAGVRHTYAAVQFNWKMFGPAVNVPGTSVYSFCNGTAEHVRATVIASGSGCASFPSGSNAAAKLAPKVSTPRTPVTATAK